MARDFYAVLGVSRTASQDDIKRAYRALSKELHPDKHKGDKAAEEKFKEVNEAYETLSDPQKRAIYDQFGEAGMRGGGGFGAGDFGDFFRGFSGFGGSGGFDMGDFGDIFGQFRDATATRRRRARGPAEVTIAVNVPLEDLGKRDFERDVSVDLMVRCRACKGERVAEGSTMITCKKCGGKGSINRTTRIPLMGSFQMRAPCPDCEGEGKIPEKPCPECRGEGEVQVRKTMRVSIPKNIRVDEIRKGKESPLSGTVDLQFRVRIPEEE